MLIEVSCSQTDPLSATKILLSSFDLLRLWYLSSPISCSEASVCGI
jgi:hypothetical protein